MKAFRWCIAHAHSKCARRVISTQNFCHAQRSFHSKSTNIEKSSMCTVSDFAQNHTKWAFMGTMKNFQVPDQISKQFRFYDLLNYKGISALVDHNVQFEMFLEAHNFIFVQAITHRYSRYF